MDKRENMAACVMCVFKFGIFDCFTTQLSPACVIGLLPPVFYVLYIVGLCN